MKHSDIDHTGLTGVGASDAADVSITDSGGYFTGTDVEAALQELGAGGGGGGGGVTITHVGYDTAGGTWETMTQNRWYFKKITPGAGMVTGIAVYARGGDGAAQNAALFAGVWTDSGGTTPNDTVAAYAQEAGSLYLTESGTGPGRWLHLPVTFQAAAATAYWIGVLCPTASAKDIAYDGSGADVYKGVGGGWFQDISSPTSTTNKYSMYAILLT